MIPTWGAAFGANAIFNSAEFRADLTHSAVPDKAAPGTTATFTRATPKTVENNDGYLVTLASGEIGFPGARRVRNLFSASQDYSNAAWTKFRSSISADATTAPDGTVTADKLVEDGTAGNSHFIQQNTVGTVGNREVASIYAKPAGRDWVYLQLGNSHYAYFNVSTGVVGTVVGSGATTSIELDEEGFYRCSLSAVRVTSQINYVAPASADNTLSYNGDGASGIYIWGAQLEDVTGRADQTTPSEYVSVGVESAPYYHGSMVDGVKCFDTDINGTPIPASTLKGYLAEGTRTNLWTYSQDFDNAAWTKTAITIAANDAAAPDGTTTADKLTNNDATSLLDRTATVTANTTYTDSIYLKYGNNAWARILYGTGADAVQLWVNIQTGVIGTVTVSSGTAAMSAYSIAPAANGFWRIQAAVNLGGAVTAFQRRSYLVNADNSGTIVAAAYAHHWGAQVELGSFASSYIPTTTAAVTRNADVLTYSSAGNIDGAKGWCYAEVSPDAVSASNQVVIGTNGANRTPAYQIAPTGAFGAYDGTNAPTFAASAFTANTSAKVSSSWGSAGLQGAVGGVVSAVTSFDGNYDFTDISVGVNNSSTNAYFGTIRNVRIGQRQLSASEMQAITS